jgi:ABC-2 type transport system ATP-binding protein
MERCHLTDVSSKVIGELSHGYRKRVGIAQAIVHRPEVVILDEPISGLDPKQIVEMRNVVRGLKQKATVLISSHILSEVALTCDRVLVIHGGRIVADWSERELGKTVADGSRLTLTLRGRPAAIDKTLADAAIVKNHTTEKKAADQVEATVELDGDRREDLVRELVHAGFGVREMHDTASELERLFLELTQRPKAKA